MHDASQTSPGESKAELTLKSMHESTLKKLKLLFITCHGMAMKARPFTDIIFQCEMDRAKGLDLGHAYQNPTAAKQFTHFISEAIRINQAEELQNAPYISIVIDGATDSARIEQELLYVHYAKLGVVKTTFLGIESVEKADAATIFNSIISNFEKNANIDSSLLYKKLVAFASDGASVMTGRKTGLVTRLRNEQPHLIGVHCVNHKLELAYKDVFKNQQTFLDIEQLLLDLYLFYEQSPLNRANLQKAAIAAGIGESGVVPLRVGGTRWVTYTYRALQRMFKAYHAIALHLSQVILHMYCTRAHVNYTYISCQYS